MNLENDDKLTIAKIAPLIRKRQISPVELTAAMLARIERLQPKINAFITVTADLARKQARLAEKEILKGRYRGVLHGIPLSLKDLFYTAGIRTTAGSKILRNFIPRENAAVVELLLAAGAVLLGKTNLHEFAYGITSVNPTFGAVHNPWDLGRIAGGSSGGSAAAVAAGMGLASMGTDTAGSIRIPASVCGVVGLKPTRGLVSLQGVIPLSFTFDHAGPICRSVEDAALLFEILAGAPAPSTPGRQPVIPGLRKGARGLRVGVPRHPFFDRLQKDVRLRVTAAHRTFADLGAKIQEVDLQGLDEIPQLLADIQVAEALTFHWNWLQKRPQDYGPDIRTRMEQGKDQRTFVYLQAQEKRKRLTAAIAGALEKVDILAVPTLPVVAPFIEAEEVAIGKETENVRLALLRMTRFASLTGLPAISLPCGLSAENLPVGLQLIGRHFAEATLLRAAYAYEQATPWHTAFPPKL